MQGIAEKIYEYLATYGLQIVAAVAIIVIGRWAAKIISKIIGSILVKTKAEPTLTRQVVGKAGGLRGCLL
jgi:small conductance mechanosensitive channel